MAALVSGWRAQVVHGAGNQHDVRAEGGIEPRHIGRRLGPPVAGDVTLDRDARRILLRGQGEAVGEPALHQVIGVELLRVRLDEPHGVEGQQPQQGRLHLGRVGQMVGEGEENRLRAAEVVLEREVHVIHVGQHCVVRTRVRLHIAGRRPPVFPQVLGQPQMGQPGDHQGRQRRRGQQAQPLRPIQQHGQPSAPKEAESRHHKREVAWLVEHGAIPGQQHSTEQQWQPQVENQQRAARRRQLLLRPTAQRPHYADEQQHPGPHLGRRHRPVAPGTLMQSIGREQTGQHGPEMVEHAARRRFRTAHLPGGPQQRRHQPGSQGQHEDAAKENGHPLSAFARQGFQAQHNDHPAAGHDQEEDTEQIAVCRAHQAGQGQAPPAGPSPIEGR